MPRTQSFSSVPTVTPEPHDLGNLPTEPEGPGLDPEALVVPEPKKRKAKIKVQDPQHLSLVPQDAQEEALQAKKKASNKLKEKRTKVVKKQAAARKKKSVTSKLKTKTEIQIPRNMLSEIWGVFFGGLSVLVMASLISYEPQDLLPTAGVTHDVINWVGPGGAHMAQFLSDFFGIGAYGLPLLTGYIALLCFKPRVFELNWLRAVGAVLTVISTTALLHVGLQGRIDVPYPVGGVVGLLVGGIMNTAVAKLGAVVISLSTFLVGLVMLTF